MSVVYLLHFERSISPDKPCQHYIGFANNLEGRIYYHRRGQSGVRLLEVAHERGIGFVVARVWRGGTRKFERQLKNKKSAPSLCPVCRGEIEWTQKTIQKDSDEPLEILYSEDISGQV